MTTWDRKKKKKRKKEQASPSNFYFKFFEEMSMKILEYKLYFKILQEVQEEGLELFCDTMRMSISKGISSKKQT